MANKDQEYDQVTLTLDDGSDLVCNVLAIFNANVNNNEQTYIALLPEDAGPEDDVYLYRYIEHGKEESDIDILNIEDDEEFEIVSDAYDELLDNEEFDAMFGEDEDQ